MIPLEFNKITEHLKSHNIEADYQKETDQLSVIFKIAEREYPLFIKIYPSGDLLQLLAFIPCNTKESTLNDTARLLHLLNKEIDIPGFGMDETSSVIFYRCMVPAQDKQIQNSIFDAYLNAIQIVCKTFASVIAAVAYGTATYADVLKKSKEQGQLPVAQAKLKKNK
jgi:hypothetical protein